MFFRDMLWCLNILEGRGYHTSCPHADWAVHYTRGPCPRQSRGRRALRRIESQDAVITRCRFSESHSPAVWCAAIIATGIGTAPSVLIRTYHDGRPRVALPLPALWMVQARLEPRVLNL